MFSTRSTFGTRTVLWHDHERGNGYDWFDGRRLIRLARNPLQQLSSATRYENIGNRWNYDGPDPGSATNTAPAQLLLLSSASDGAVDRDDPLLHRIQHA